MGTAVSSCFSLCVGKFLEDYTEDLQNGTFRKERDPSASRPSGFEYSTLCGGTSHATNKVVIQGPKNNIH